MSWLFRSAQHHRGMTALLALLWLLGSLLLAQGWGQWSLLAQLEEARLWQRLLLTLPFMAGLLCLCALIPGWAWWRHLHRYGHLGHAVSHELANAIRHHEFYIQYLPTIEHRSGRCIGAEALLRWRHPHQGTIMPDLFIPIAERSGMILPMTEWLVQQLLAEQAAWLRANRDCHLSINISAAHLASRQFLPQLYTLLQQHAVLPDQLVLEITERELINRSSDETRKVLHQVTQYGFRLAIDDFGTGYNNLARLYEFGFELIKIDRSLMRTAVDKEGGDRIFDAILTVANGYGAPVLVEGVEYPADLAFLATRDIHSVQGWYFSRPLGVREFQHFHALHPGKRASVRTHSDVQSKLAETA